MAEDSTLCLSIPLPRVMKVCPRELRFVGTLICFVHLELKDFFDVLPNILAGPESVFSFWNGLGATSKLSFATESPVELTLCALDPTIYDVASNLAALHLDDVGMKVSPPSSYIRQSLIWLLSYRRNGTT